LILIPTLVGVSVVAFLLVRMIPGDPVIVMLGEHATAERYQRLAKLLGLDQPLPVQYWDYLKRMVSGDWGTSLFGQELVLPLLLRRLRATMELAFLAIAISSVIGITLGVVSGLRQGSWIDKAIRLVTLFLFSIPTFWLALVLILVFAVNLGWVPAMGRGTASQMVLPVVTLAAWSVGLIARVTRISVLDTQGQDFVMTARAKGIGARRIVLHHLLPNSLIPVVTVIGLQFGGLIGGAVVAETVFNYPGLGQIIVESVFSRDYPVVQGAILLAAVVFTAINLMTDLLYAFLDPRIRYSHR
jgi:ABC-type dipeptide/oligopeptide/nickel transport system permease component